MKEKLNTNDLLPWLGQVSKVINKKATIDILKTIRIEALENGLYLTASDGDMWIEAKTDVEQCDEYGVECVIADDLLTAFRNIGKDKLVTVITENGAMDISYESGGMSLPVQNAEEYPKVRDIAAGGARIEAGMDCLINAVRSVNYAAAKDDMLRPIMSGVCLDFTANGFTAAASEGHILARKFESLPTEGVPQDGQRIVLPPKVAATLSDGLSDGTKFSLTVGDDRIVIKCGRYRIVSKQMEGEYPNYEAVIPQQHSMKVKVSSKDFLKAVGRVGAFGDQTTDLVTLSFKDDTITVKANDINYRKTAYESVKGEIDGEIAGMKIGIKSVNLISAMSHIEGETVYIELSDPSRAIVIYGESGREKHLSLLMPMMINE